MSVREVVDIDALTQMEEDSRPTRRRGRPRRRWSTVVVYVLLIGVGLTCLLPFYWLLRSSLMSDEQIFTFPPQWIPDPITWSNYSGAFEAAPFVRYFLNTLTIAVLVVVGTLLSTSAAAFAFSRLVWPGRRIVFGLLLSSLLLPWAVTLVPSFIGWQWLGFVDTFVPLTAPAFFAAGQGFNIFLLRQFFLQIPIELDNAVYVDGGSPWTVYWRVILPLNKGPLTLVAIFSTIFVWNDLLGPVIYLNSEENYTLSQGLASFTGTYTSDWGYLMAATLIVILPVVVLFFFAQRHIIEGVALTGLKG
ncbi:sugar ABC transporter permease [Microbacterium barkeri]|uniref:Sugar ABC transporter permease n=1 Tax=Microbacterium barkeri TaxID=33917 RepID=A0A9W6H4W6_9MICO|nr:carbohydrate ABC transporter permease [Microbacterium barkeri]MDI6944667.1 carbohydrate ABC transporter permease [Microbacterium barkeri]MDR6877156.1 multiple sugar transport system permease protein [Microbacterium barkeri]GLJ62686.1 sugar ABC transporter permease [Microbacterium barkeri]